MMMAVVPATTFGRKTAFLFRLLLPPRIVVVAVFFFLPPNSCLEYNVEVGIVLG